MLRQLFTLLALLSGFAALVEPAHARVAGVESVSLSVSDARPCIAQRGTLPLRTPARPVGAEPMLGHCRYVRLPVFVPPLMLQVDRAHE